MTGGSDIKALIENLIKKKRATDSRFGGKLRNLSLEVMSGDGSARKFIRVRCGKEPLCVAVLPPSSSTKDMAEFRAAVDIGTHLYQAGAAVPEVLAHDERGGLILFEDLGNTRLHDLLAADRHQALDYYPRVVQELIRLQVNGSRNFEPDWCFDTAAYNEQVMLERESGYFLEAFLHDTVHMAEVDGLAEEFEDIARQVMSCSEPLFLHRDFQSRNIMIDADRITIIDFQAGRLGPPGYDLASLLIDPYAGLDAGEQQKLFSLYLQEMQAYPEVTIDKIIRSFPFLAVQRNLQIIGAFANLSGKMQKPFFRPYILPSLIMLRDRLEENIFRPYSVLRKTVEEALTCFHGSVR
jgi:aminoglycoside/choline kinase family phosphotransferase